MIYRIKVFSRLTYKGLSPYKANLLRKYRRVLAHNLLTDRKVYYQQNNNNQFPKFFLDEAKSYAERIRRDIINGVNKKEIESYLYKKYSPKVSIKSQNNDFIKGFRRVENGAGEKFRTGEQTLGSAIDSVKNIGKAKKNPVPPKKFIEKTIPSKINQESYDPFKQVDGNYNPFNQNISNKKNFSNTLEEIIKENIISHIPSKEIVATAIAKKVEEKYLNGETKDKKESREKDIEYQDQPIRRNNITLRKPEIKYRKEEKEETPEIIRRSVMEYPDSDE